MGIPSFNKLPIKHKLTVLFLAVTVLVLFLHSIFTISSQVQLLRKARVDSLATLAETIIKLRPDSFDALNHKKSRDLLSSLEAEKDIEMAVLYNKDNIVYAMYVLPSKKITAIIPGRVQKDGASFILHEGQLKLSFFHPVYKDDTRVGTLYFLTTLDKIYEYLLFSGVALLMNFVAIFILILFVSGKLQKIFTRQISNLAETTKHISNSGDYSIRVVKGSDDEIGQLIDEFNTMLEMIQERDEELSQHRYNLEMLVQERTEELRTKRDEALAAANAKSEFLANMSHEIRTPMNGVIGVLSLLKDAPLNEEHRRLLETATRSADSLLMIINDILDFSKIEAGMVEFESIPYDLREIIEEVTLLFVDTVDPSKIDLICYIPMEVETHVVGDPTRLRQILTNLMSNGIKFTDEGEVVIRVSVVEQKENEQILKISVEDTGVGIGTDSISNLFEKFTQADGSTTRQYGGTGLGLSVCKQLVELQGGEIGVESDGENGSSFWFTMSFVSAADRTVGDECPALEGKHCVIVDDNTTNCEILEHYLQPSGALLHMCYSAQETLMYMKQSVDVGKPVDLILMDYHMPVMDGIQLAKVLQDKYDIDRLVMLSSGNVSSRLAFDAGIADIIFKPVRRSQLYRILSDGGSGSHLDQERKSLSEVERNKEISILKGKILLVDDEPINLKVALAILEKFGLSADTASNGREAVEMVRKNQYDVVLLDIQMPEMSGFEATEAIREWEKIYYLPPVIIIAMTANALESVREQCMAAGMNDYISKPIKPEDLADRLLPWVTVDDSFPAQGSGICVGGRGWNHKEALELVGRDEQLLSDMAKLFLQRMDGLIGNIQEAVRLNDGEKLYDAAHAYKGAVGHFVCSGLRDLLIALEEKGKDNNLEQAAVLLGQVIEQSNGLKHELKKYAENIY